MLRHMDAAWEISGGKRVLGLIVEGQGCRRDRADDHWLTRDHQVLERTLADSLLTEALERDHRSRNLRSYNVAEGVRGFGLSWPPCQDTG
jgi:hypothetical protein